MTKPFTLHRGAAPLVVSLPHVGTELPAELRPRLVSRALATEDTDWFLEQLYGFVTGLGATLLVPRMSRIVVDLNRPRDDRPMYPGANNTGLCPTRFFTGDPIYRAGEEPDAAEIAARAERWWVPYHDALAAELARVRAAHGHAVLLDGHSIRSELPWLFEGTLPNLNFGSAGGTSCDPALAAAVLAHFGAGFTQATGFTSVLDGRFKGGHITRAYGRPADGVHALQLEMAWRTYMEETPPWRWRPARAAAITPHLQAMVHTLIDWRPR